MSPANMTHIYIRRILWLFATALSFAYLNSPIVARLRDAPTTVFVEIAGENYGHFESIAGLEDLVGQASKNGYTTVSLKRDFVTERSLSNWAATTNKLRRGPQDVHLIKKSEDGQIIRRYVLRLSHPLSWSVEQDADTAPGGYHEKVELAVQEVTIR
ncbi:MAG: hypothetical protein AB8C84_02355 [Oligoflexales bacterium]